MPPDIGKISISVNITYKLTACPSLAEKTTKFVKWQMKQGFIPKAEHILQVQCYGTMFSKVFQVENLNIIYVDMNDIITYKICTRDLTQWIKARIQELEDSIAEKELPRGNVSGLCKYCRYQTRCYNDGNGVIDKPLSIPRNVTERS
jgi:CRISPR/Cas system-associated exonuclease Cas4 (RecB family)